MQEVVRINLDNEMDLILAHKRTMKLAELCGLSIPAQTTFATAVSEIARSAIGHGKKSFLVLGIQTIRVNKKEIVACLYDTIDLSKANVEAFAYAKRLMGDLHTVQKDGLYEVRLTHHVNFSGTISDTKIQSFKEYFKNEPPLSPYDEIRKKNIQLIDLTEKIKESEAQYRMLSETLPLMMFSINQKEEVIFSNKWLNDFFRTQHAPASNILWHSMMHPDDFKKISQEWNKSWLNKTPFKTQGRLKYKDKFIWHLISIVPVKNERDNNINWIGFFVDIDAQKVVEETLKDNKELKSIQRELVKRNNELEQFAYIASHDLQEPLRKIRTFSALLQERLELTDKDRSYFNKIMLSSDRMSKLIRDVLNYSEISNSREVFEDVDLNEILTTVKTDFELLIDEKEATLSSVPLPTVKGIPLQLSQLFCNFISNSLKFSTKPPVITIACKTICGGDVQVAGLDPSKEYHQLAFHDNGIGFEQHFSHQIFTIFQRLHNRQTYAGTGMGLALCKKIMENHRGAIRAHGELGKGATFEIFLPIH